MKITNEQFQDIITLAYDRMFSGPVSLDTSLAVQDSAGTIAAAMADQAAQQLLREIPETDLESAAAVWNADENRLTRQYIIARMADRANDERYTEEYRQELNRAIGRLPLGIDSMNLDI